MESQFVRKTELFFHCPLSRFLPASLAIASPFYGVLSTEPCTSVYYPFSFVSALFEGHGNIEDPRAKGIEAWASVRFDCVSELKQIMEVRCLSVVDDLMLSSSSRLAFGDHANIYLLVLAENK